MENKQMKEESTTKWRRFLNWIAEYQMPCCIGCSLIGFGLAALLLFTGTSGRVKSVTKDKKHAEKSGLLHSPYGVIRLDNKVPLITKMLNRRIELLNAQVATLETDAKLKKAAAEKPNNLQAQSELTKVLLDISRQKDMVSITRKEVNRLQNINQDTSVAYFARYLQVKDTALLARINSEQWQNDTIHAEKVKVSVIDTCHYLLNYPIITEDVLNLKQDKRDLLIDFLGDYPMFGLWLVIGIAQTIMWFMLIPILTGNLLMLKDKLKNYSIQLDYRWINALLPAFVLFIFCAVFYQCMVDRVVIPDQYFLNHFTDRMTVFGIIGYLIAAFCFYNYLTLARQFDQVNTNFVQAIAGEDSNAAALAQYTSLRGAFDNAFLCSAMVLSVFVFWEGILFNALNATEVFRYYQAMSTKSILPSDFVYLMGLLHTLILLAFYIPVELKFRSLPVTQNAMQVAAGAPVKGTFGLLFSSLGTLLVTASPLIASFVQSLIKIILPTT